MAGLIVRSTAIVRAFTAPLLGAVILSTAAVAQDEWQGPRIGYVAGEGGRVREILGTPGAARQSGTDLTARALHHARGFAVIDVSDAPMAFVRKPGREPVPIEGMASGAASVVFSARGSAAAAWFEERRIVQVLGGLPDSPHVVRELEMPEAPIRFAVSDDGALLAIGLETGINLYGPDGNTSVALRAAALRFVEGTGDLVIGEADTGAVWLAGAGGSQARIAEAGEGTSVAALWLSPDRRSLILAAGSLVTVYDLIEQRSSAIECRCRPRMVEPLERASTFLLSDASSEPLWLLDTSEGAPQITFVPAVAQEPEP